MRDFKNDQIIFYCNACGELHKNGKEDLKSVEELPLPLQSVYERFWTDSLSVPCYIAYVDGRPGLLLLAEYNEEWCKGQNITNEHDGKYAELRERCQRMEKLVHTVCTEAEVGIGLDTGFDMELGLFIPTGSISDADILKLYYLMDEFAFTVPPEEVIWGDHQLELLAKRCQFSSESGECHPKGEEFGYEHGRT